MDEARRIASNIAKALRSGIDAPVETGVKGTE
jgi:hypothetical protein